MQDRQSPSDEVRALREAIAGVIRHNRRFERGDRRKEGSNCKTPEWNSRQVRKVREV